MTLLWIAIGVAIGSISGTRIVGRGVDLADVRVVVSGTGETAPLEGVSPSALLAMAGTRAGLTATAIDLIKAVSITLAARLITDPDTAAWCALAVCVGHVYPVWHSFKGGFGVTPLIGSLLVLDPVGFLVSLTLGVLFGTAIGNAYVMTELWPLLLTPWAVWQNRPTALGFVLGATVLFVWRSRREFPVAWRAWRGDERPWRARISDIKRYPEYVPRQS